MLTLRRLLFLVPLPAAASLGVGLSPRVAQADVGAAPESRYRGGPDGYRERRFESSEQPPLGHDGFADERDERCEHDAGGACDDHRDAASSTLRVHVGPALLLQPLGTGLFTALDMGEHAVGARLSGAWLHAGSQSQLVAYSGELWIDFRHRYALHPVVGAGASFLHGSALGAHPNAGAGLLRGALEYQLPVADADARVGLSLLGVIPAIESERTRPWAALSLTVGAGF